jgi:hypothetical protein
MQSAEVPHFSLHFDGDNVLFEKFTGFILGAGEPWVEVGDRYRLLAAWSFANAVTLTHGRLQKSYLYFFAVVDWTWWHALYFV